ncbi:unnamed protein product [Closterium sp. Naga37s-1]|nr:unnamed protein product [Closterium sp. Naga37s-1]
MNLFLFFSVFPPSFLSPLSSPPSVSFLLFSLTTSLGGNPPSHILRSSLLPFVVPPVRSPSLLPLPLLPLPIFSDLLCLILLSFPSLPSRSYNHPPPPPPLCPPSSIGNAPFFSPSNSPPSPAPPPCAAFLPPASPCSAYSPPVLGVARDASQQDIRAAYKKLARRWHLDKNQGAKAAHERFLSVQAAYEMVGEEEARKRFDRYGADADDHSGGGQYQRQQRYQHHHAYSDSFFSHWGQQQSDDLMPSATKTLTAVNFGQQVLGGGDAWLIQIFSIYSPQSRAFAPHWEKLASEFEGVVRFGRVEVSEQRRLASVLANHKCFRSSFGFGSGFPAFVAFTPSCRDIACCSSVWASAAPSSLRSFLTDSLLLLPYLPAVSPSLLESLPLRLSFQKPVVVAAVPVESSSSASSSSAAAALLLQMRVASADPQWRSSLHFSSVALHPHHLNALAPRLGMRRLPCLLIFKDPQREPLVVTGKWSKDRLHDVLSKNQSPDLLSLHKDSAPLLRFYIPDSSHLFSLFSSPSSSSSSSSSSSADSSHPSLPAHGPWYSLVLIGHSADLALSKFSSFASSLSEIRKLKRILDNPPSSSSSPPYTAFSSHRLFLSWLDASQQPAVCRFLLSLSPHSHTHSHTRSHAHAHSHVLPRIITQLAQFFSQLLSPVLRVLPSPITSSLSRLSSSILRYLPFSPFAPPPSILSLCSSPSLSHYTTHYLDQFLLLSSHLVSSLSSSFQDYANSLSLQFLGSPFFPLGQPKSSLIAGWSWGRWGKERNDGKASLRTGACPAIVLLRHQHVGTGGGKGGKGGRGNGGWGARWGELGGEGVRGGGNKRRVSQHVAVLRRKGGGGRASGRGTRRSEAGGGDDCPLVSAGEMFEWLSDLIGGSESHDLVHPQFRALQQQPPALAHPNTWWDHTLSPSSSSSSSLPSWFLPSALLSFLWQSFYACKHTLELLLGEPLGEAISSPLLSAFITLVVIYTIGTCLGAPSTASATGAGGIRVSEEEEGEEEEEEEGEEEEEEEGEEDGEEEGEGWGVDQQKGRGVKKREEARTADDAARAVAWERKRLNMWEHGPTHKPSSDYLPPLSRVTRDALSSVHSSSVISSGSSSKASSSSSRGEVAKVGVRSSGGGSSGREKQGRMEGGGVVELSSSADCWWLPADRRTGSSSTTSGSTSSSSSMLVSGGSTAPYAVVMVLRDCASSDKDAALTSYREVAASFAKEPRLVFSYVDSSKHQAWLSLLSLFSPRAKGGRISEDKELSGGDRYGGREGNGVERREERGKEQQEEGEGWVEVESEGRASRGREGVEGRRDVPCVGTAAVIVASFSSPVRWFLLEAAPLPVLPCIVQCIGNMPDDTVKVLVTRVERLLDGSFGPWVPASWPALS